MGHSLLHPFLVEPLIKVLLKTSTQWCMTVYYKYCMQVHITYIIIRGESLPLFPSHVSVCLSGLGINAAALKSPGFGSQVPPRTSHHRQQYLGTHHIHVQYRRVSILL